MQNWFEHLADPPVQPNDPASITPAGWRMPWPGRKAPGTPAPTPEASLMATVITFSLGFGTGYVVGRLAQTQAMAPIVIRALGL